jgi:hypothetical protein
MNRPALGKAIALALAIIGTASVCHAPAVASPPERANRLTEEDRKELLRYATDTWRSFERLALPSGLPADGISCDGNGWGKPWMQTSPTNIAAYFWSTLAADRLTLITHKEANSRLEKTLSTLARMERFHGFYLNDIDPQTGEALKISPFDSQPRKQLLSSVDNGWLAAALHMVANTQPPLRERAIKLLKPMDFRFFYDPYDSADPVRHPGLLRVGFWVKDNSFYGHYGMLNTEPRIASYLGIALGQLPTDHYYRMHRALPEDRGVQGQAPRGGGMREYMGVKVVEGSNAHRGARIVPSWGESMFEALMVTLFVPEDNWASRSWGRNHPLYTRAQIEHGLADAAYGSWGFSSASSPRGGYQPYGIKALGTVPGGYLSYDKGGRVPEVLQEALPPVQSHGVVTSHAVFLALRFAPREAMANLHALAARFPIYGPLGFFDSMDVSAGVVSGCVLALDQGMIMAAIANELGDDCVQHSFSDGLVEQRIRPLLAMEEFNAGPAEQTGGSVLKPDLLQGIHVRIK